MTFCRVLFQIWAPELFSFRNHVCMPLNDNGSINGLWESNLEEFNKISAKKILATGQNSSICCCVAGVREMCIMNPNSGV
jgi:hypothetical protein